MNWRPHPYQLIGIFQVVTIQGFQAISAQKDEVFSALNPIVSIRLFSRVGRGVGQSVNVPHEAAQILHRKKQRIKSAHADYSEGFCCMWQAFSLASAFPLTVAVSRRSHSKDGQVPQNPAIAFSALFCNLSPFALMQ
ncbi:MAG: hypothetical protein GXW99_08950 [Clostridiales bacterium]|nr:hypothetical protein [Clostridiales bacterium]